MQITRLPKTLHKHYTENKSGRDFVVGDIHGMYDLFMEKLNNVGFNPQDDRIFSVGDLIDRGPDSLDCLSLSKCEWFIPVMGNHELIMSESIRQRVAEQIWINNGGVWAYQLDRQERYDWIDYILEHFPIFITLDCKDGKQLGICHAESPTDDWHDVSIDGANDIELYRSLWGRTVLNRMDKDLHIKNIDATVHGHTIVDEITSIGNCLFIDTGSFLKNYDGYDGDITLIEVNEVFENVKKLDNDNWLNELKES